VERRVQFVYLQQNRHNIDTRVTNAKNESFSEAGSSEYTNSKQSKAAKF